MGSVGYKNYFLFPEGSQKQHPLPRTTMETHQKGNMFLRAVWLKQEERPPRNIVSLF
jgi:hypothetical protein